MAVTHTWGHFECSGGYISTGIAKIYHNIGHDKYEVFTQIRQQGTEVVVTGIYSTYFTCAVRNSSGTLVSAPFSFEVVGHNYQPPL